MMDLPHAWHITFFVIMMDLPFNKKNLGTSKCG